MAEPGFTPPALRCHWQSPASLNPCGWKLLLASVSVPGTFCLFGVSHLWNTLPSLYTGSTQHLEGVLIKSYGLSVQWRNLSRIWNNIDFHSEIFCSVFVSSPPLVTPSPPAPHTLVITRVRCHGGQGFLTLTVNLLLSCLLRWAWVPEPKGDVGQRSAVALMPAGPYSPWGQGTMLPCLCLWAVPGWNC